jgi:hypothetical protein
LNFAPSLGGARSCGQWLNSKTFAADALRYFVVPAALLRDSSDYDTLFEIADKRLYEAKAAGRNHVVGPESPCA